MIRMFREIRKKKNAISVDEAKELLRSSKRGVFAVNGDAFGLVTVIYSVVLFLLGIVGTFKQLPNRYVILGVAIAGFLFRCSSCVLLFSCQEFQVLE